MSDYKIAGRLWIDNTRNNTWARVQGSDTYWVILLHRYPADTEQLEANGLQDAIDKAKEALHIAEREAANA